MVQMRTRSVIVTGGGTGIGLAIAQHLANCGHDVTVTGRRREVLESTGLNFVEMDVTDRGSIERGLSAIGDVDVFVANAGRADTAPALKMDLESFDAMLEVNLKSVFHCAQTAIPAMRTRGFGRFIVVASTAALKGYRYTAGYAAAKHGVLGFIRCLALELGKTGVTANAICPGFTDTPLIDAAVDNIGRKTGLDRDQAIQQMVADNPQGRLVDPMEVAACAAWLVSDGAAAVNGQAIAIDGGETAS